MDDNLSIIQKLQEISQRISEIDKQLAELKEEKKSLESAREGLGISRNTSLVLNQVYNITDANSIHVRLREYTKTTPIMDAFYKSDCTFLIFDRILHVNSTWASISLIVVRSSLRVISKNDGLTMTDLKKASGNPVYHDSIYVTGEDNRYKGLAVELTKIIDAGVEDGKTYAFQMPCVLGGQTFANQTGYGSEYNGDECVYQGTLYGETTKFLIIGAIIG